MFGNKKNRVKGPEELLNKNAKFELLEQLLTPISQGDSPFTDSGISRLAETILSSELYYSVAFYPTRRREFGMNVLFPIVARFWGCKLAGTPSCPRGACYLEDLACCDHYVPNYSKKFPTGEGKEIDKCWRCGKPFDVCQEPKLSNIFCDSCKDRLLDEIQERAFFVLRLLDTIKPTLQLGDGV